MDHIFIKILARKQIESIFEHLELEYCVIEYARLYSDC